MTVAERQTEAQFQSAVIEYARLRKWLVHHARPALRQSGGYSTPIQGDSGFPDLVLARRDRVVFAELKAEKGRVRTEQAMWIGVLEASGAEAHVWRPSDWDEIERVLR